MDDFNFLDSENTGDWNPNTQVIDKKKEELVLVRNFNSFLILTGFRNEDENRVHHVIILLHETRKRVPIRAFSDSCRIQAK